MSYAHYYPPSEDIHFSLLAGYIPDITNYVVSLAEWLLDIIESTGVLHFMSILESTAYAGVNFSKKYPKRFIILVVSGGITYLDGGVFYLYKWIPTVP